MFVYPDKEFNQLALADALGVSSTAISKSLKRLVKEGLIVLDKEKWQISISLNRGNPAVIGLKRAENLRMLYDSGLCMFLFDSFPGATLVVFGSYSFGEDVSSSDIDIAVIGSSEKDTSLDAFEKILHRKIVLQFYPSLGKIHKYLKDNILNGILIKGGFEI